MERLNTARHDWLLATLCGVSWYLLAAGSVWLARELRGASWGQSVPWRQLVGMARLSLGICLYLPLGLFLVRDPGTDVRCAAASLGVVPERDAGWQRSGVYVVSALLLSALVDPIGARKLIVTLSQSRLGAIDAIQPPLVEEFLARGLVWALLARSSGVAVAVLWSSVLFGCWHIERGLGTVVGTALVSVPLFALPRLLSGTIWPAAVFHLMGNANLLAPALFMSTICSAAFFCRDRRRPNNEMQRTRPAQGMRPRR